MQTSIHFADTDFFLNVVELRYDLRQALLDCGRSGDASEAVDYVIDNFEITGDMDDCAKYLYQYGAWDDEQLQDHNENLRRLVWLTGSAMVEGEEPHFATY